MEFWERYYYFKFWYQNTSKIWIQYDWFLAIWNSFNNILYKQDVNFSWLLSGDCCAVIKL